MNDKTKELLNDLKEKAKFNLEMTKRGMKDIAFYKGIKNDIDRIVVLLEKEIENTIDEMQKEIEHFQHLYEKSIDIDFEI